MKIGAVELDNPTILAPLAGITNLPFRLLAKDAGCALVFSEMISANGLLHRSKKTLALLDSRPEEKPLAVQIFGADPEIMAAAAAMVEDSGADLIDINFGCAVKKIVKTGAGVGLMRTPELAGALLSAVRRAVRVPLTIKIRAGWEASGRQALEISRIAEACGVDAIAIHPRTAVQGFRGRADWRLISVVKKAVYIPVIGNGDIMAPRDALEMVDQTGCDAVMVGRAAVGNPLIFEGIRRVLNGQSAEAPTPQQRLSIMVRYVQSSVDYMGEATACRVMRSRLGWFVKGLSHGSRFRESIKKISSQAEALEKIRAYAQDLGVSPPPAAVNRFPA